MTSASPPPTAAFRVLLARATAVVAGVAACELLSRSEILGRGAFPPMTVVLVRLLGELAKAELWIAVGQTLAGWLVGLAVATATAVTLGALIGSHRLLYRAVRVPIELLRPVPSVALVPLAILLYGVGFASKVFLVVFASFWILLVQTLHGVQHVDPVAIDTARVFGFSWRARLICVTLPGAAPYVATGLRMASTVALVLAVTAELVIGAPGLGLLISLARSGADIDLMYALIIVTGTLGWAINAGVSRMERAILHWHPARRPT